MKAPDMGKMVGPLPLGAWLAALGAGLALAWYVRRRGSSAPPEVVPEPSDPSLSFGSGQINQGSAIALPGGGASSGGTSTPPQSNEEWGRLATQTLIAKNFDPLVATNAIADYLAGQPLDVRETAALTLVLGLIGAPPNPVPGVSTTPPPSSGTPPVGAPGRSNRRWLSGGGQAGQANADVVASVSRHDGRGGYTVSSMKQIRPFAPVGYRMPPMIVWTPAQWTVAASLGKSLRIDLAADDRSGTLTDTKTGRKANFTIPAPAGKVAA